MRCPPASRMAIATFQLFFRASASAAVMALLASSSVMYLVVPGICCPPELQIECPIWYSEYMSVEIAHIRHVGLFSPDLEEHSRFYSDIWGLQPLAETPDRKSTRLN